MQVNITPSEKRTIINMTKPKGKAKWFREGAGISFHSLQRLRRLGDADEEVVNKVRSFLQEQGALIAQ